VKHPLCALFRSKLLILPAIIRPGWKGLPGTNTVAYYRHLYITEENSFIILVPGIVWMESDGKVWQCLDESFGLNVEKL
jgi:hypothetical protein